MTMTATARIACQAPGRHAKKLVTALSADERARAVTWDAESGTGGFNLGRGEISLVADGDLLLLHIEAPDEQTLVRTEAEVGWTLIRLATKLPTFDSGSLEVRWRRGGGVPGTTQHGRDLNLAR